MKISSTHVRNASSLLFTKEPLISHNTPKGAWQDVRIDLFGPMPDQKHVSVVLDKMSRFPAAKVVPSTAAKPVIKALSDIYTSLGQPDSHQTDNAPPPPPPPHLTPKHSTNSQILMEFSTAETFMKLLGKTIKSANLNKDDKEEALNVLLAQYRATLHPAKGVTPGNIMFRSGYRRDFTHRALSESEITEAIKQDEKQRKHCGQTVNKSTH